MTVSITDEDVMRLRELAKLAPRGRNGKKTALSTLIRWGTVGIKGVRLELLKAGSVWCSSPQALQRFFDRLTAIESAGVLPSQDRPAAAAADDADVNQRLNEMGF